MDQEKIGNYIKKIRIDNNLTQKEFADILSVTPQAVSKWENGKNIPDVQILTLISDKFNVDVSEILNGKNKKRNNLNYIIIVLIIIVVLISIVLFTPKKDKKYNFDDITSVCEEYKISGIAVYDEHKSSLYISSIEYCGEELYEDEFDEIECILYEKYDDTLKEITKCDSKSDVKLSDYLSKLSIKVEDYKSICKDFKDINLYIRINGKKGNENRNWEIPIRVTSCRK